MSIASEIAAQIVTRVGVPRIAVFTVQLIASVADNGSGFCRITVRSRMQAAAAHNLSVDDVVTISGIQGAGANGLNTDHTVTEVVSGSVFDTNIAYAGTPTANTGKFQQVVLNGTIYSDSRANSWSWPSGVHIAFATYCGGGQGGAGGHSTGGGGGGGGASNTFRELPITPNEARDALSIRVGIGGAGGAVGGYPTIATGSYWNTALTAITGGSQYGLPTGRPDTSNGGRAAPGGAADGGAGGAGAPMKTTAIASPAAGLSTLGGPAGGAAGTSTTPGQPGADAIRRGVYATTGGAGGGGGSSNAASYGGSGGADDRHGDQYQTDGASGGAGGGSAFGGSASGAGTAGSGVAYTANGPGGGGGGGAGGSNAYGPTAGADGGDGIVILRWYV